MFENPNNLKMVIHIQSGKNNLNSSVQESTVQLIPCKIAADCNAEVSKFFKPYVKHKEDSTYTASFRGYPLKGMKIGIPDGYTGVVLHERIKPETDEDDRKFYVINNFSSFMHWNWGKDPTEDDSIVKAINEWIDIAEADPFTVIHVVRCEGGSEIGWFYVQMSVNQA